MLTNSEVSANENIYEEIKRNLNNNETKKIDLEKQALEQDFLFNKYSWINDLNLTLSSRYTNNHLYEETLNSVNVQYSNQILNSSIYNALFNSDILKKYNNINTKISESKISYKLIDLVLKYQLLDISIKKLLLSLKEIKKKVNNSKTDNKNNLLSNIAFNNQKVKKIELKLKMLDLKKELSNIRFSIQSISDYKNYNILYLNINKILKNKYKKHLEDNVTSLLVEKLRKEKELSDKEIIVEDNKKYGSLSFKAGYSYTEDSYQLKLFSKNEDYNHNYNVELNYTIPIYSVRNSISSQKARIKNMKLLNSIYIERNNFKNKKIELNTKLDISYEKLDLYKEKELLTSIEYEHKMKDYREGNITDYMLLSYKLKYENVKLEVKEEEVKINQLLLSVITRY
jgi:hypothetical protein